MSDKVMLLMGSLMFFSCLIIGPFLSLYIIETGIHYDLCAALCLGTLTILATITGGIAWRM